MSLFTYDLTLGLPHTNHRFFAEPFLMKYAGHFQWQSIAAAGRPAARDHPPPYEVAHA